ncbi:MAG: IS66 family transposase [Saezia sp.]
MTESPKFTREEFDRLYEDKEALYAFFQILNSSASELSARLAELEQRLGLNSTNSSKPPSSDGLSKPKPKSLREKTGKKPGAQKGHVGKTLAPKEIPDIIIMHEPKQCTCGCDLEATPGRVIQKRQVADLPKIELIYTEHQAVEKECPNCHQKNRAAFPDGIEDAAVQYGARVLALIVYLNTGQFLSYERTAEACEAIFGFRPGEGTIQSALSHCYEGLELHEKEVLEKLSESPVLHCDETGIRVEGKIAWFHVASTKELTHYHADEKRGKNALDNIGLLFNYEGTAIHDCLSSYFQYEIGHGLCNAHILRELCYVSEEMCQSWASEMSLHLKSGLKGKESQGIPSELEYQKYVEEYERILSEGRKQQPEPVPKPKGQRGREAKSKSHNLLERLVKYRDAVLLFLKKEEVPFTNNQAERDIRMAKVKMKVSGNFRTREGAKVFARIRGAISTFQKQGQKVFENLENIFTRFAVNSCNPE